MDRRNHFGGKGSGGTKTGQANQKNEKGRHPYLLGAFTFRPKPANDMGILNECMNRDIQVWTIKDNYRLGSDINSKVLAFAFGLSAEIERNLISQRTKEALARKRAEGVILGRPKGSKSKKTKLTGQEKKVHELLDKKVSYSAIGRILGVHRLTVSAFVKTQNLQVPV